MRFFIAFISLVLLTSVAYSQADSDLAKASIQQDYASILEGIIELKYEIRKTSDKGLLNELKAAQKGLINDYISGPYALFESQSTIESAYVKSIGKYSESNIRSFLINYSGKDYKDVQIDVERVVSVEGKNNWYEVYFSSMGEISTQMTSRKAIVNIVGDQSKIRRISFANREKREIASVVKTKKTEVTLAQETTLHTEPIIDEPIPMITMGLPWVSNSNELEISGSIINGIQEGVISAYINNEFINGLSYNLSQNLYKLSIPSYILPANSKSFDLELKYDYGKKFIKVRKNIVLFQRDLLSANTPSKMTVAPVGQEEEEEK